MAKKIRVAVVGLKFGSEFVKFYRAHPNVAYVGICEADPVRLAHVGETMGFARRHRRLEEVLDSDDYDAVHLLTPIPDHARQAIAVMDSGKHCACAVTMGSTLDELREVVAVQKETGKNYMMMETAAYTREYLHVKELYDNGTLGKIQFLRGAHYDDVDGLAGYWQGLPPQHYVTHAVGPILALTGGRASQVSCFGSGRMREELHKNYGNPFPIESALFRIHDSDVAFEITRTMHETAVVWKETFDVYGDRATFLWSQYHGGDHTLIAFDRTEPGRKHTATVSKVVPPVFPQLVPKELETYATEGYHTSHAHLVHEFISSIIEERAPAIDAVTAANWCAPGICAHESALKGGEMVTIPAFDEE
jgi:predicted dehydrogenase